RQPGNAVTRLDDRQVGLGHPAGTFEVAHVGADAGVGLRAALEGERLADLLDRGQHHAIGDGSHQRVEQVDHLRAVGLQLLDHFLARQQAGLLAIELFDLGDAGLDLLDLVLQVGVAGVLAVDLGVVVAVDQEPQQQAGQRGDAQHDAEFLLALLAALGAPREEVDACHQSKLLRASPQAIMSAGASWASACACTRDPSVICASGLAMTDWTPSCSSTISEMPAIEAQPPARTTWSTRLNSLPA